MAVPATPAITIAHTSGANSRITASTNRPPSRSMAPNRLRKLAAWIPAGPKLMATEVTIIGNQPSRSANRNCCTNSLPYEYGGRTAATSVLPVSATIAPTSSTKLFADTYARTTANASLRCGPILH